MPDIFCELNCAHYQDSKKLLNIVCASLKSFITDAEHAMALSEAPPEIREKFDKEAEHARHVIEVAVD